MIGKSNLGKLVGMITMTQTEAEAFADEWMAAWNSHDPDRIAAHYHEDVEYYSPFVAQIAAAQTGGGGVLLGRAVFHDYAAAALERFPDLHFGPDRRVAAGSGSVAIEYRSVNDLLAIETLVLDDDALVVRAHCHYSPAA